MRTPQARAQVLADESSFKIHPSVVSFHPNGGVVVGAAAKQRKVIDPKNTIFSVKRLIGRSYDSRRGRRPRSRGCRTRSRRARTSMPIIVTRGGEFAVPEISAIVLDHMKNVATGALGHAGVARGRHRAGEFNDAQRSATATAGAIAGLTVLRVLNEPTAAALAYGHAQICAETIAVYDFGGGTFDITMLKLARPGLRGARHCRRHVPRRRRPRRAPRRLHGREVPRRKPHRPARQRSLDDAAARGRRADEDRAVAAVARGGADRRDRVRREGQAAQSPRSRSTRDEFVAQVADIIDRTFPVVRRGADARRPRHVGGSTTSSSSAARRRFRTSAIRSRSSSARRRARTSTPKRLSRSAPRCRRSRSIACSSDLVEVERAGRRSASSSMMRRRARAVTSTPRSTSSRPRPSRPRPRRRRRSARCRCRRSKTSCPSSPSRLRSRPTSSYGDGAHGDRRATAARS